MSIENNIDQEHESSMFLCENGGAPSVTNISQLYARRDVTFQPVARGRAMNHFFAFEIGRKNSLLSKRQVHNRIGIDWDMCMNIPKILFSSGLAGEVVQQQDRNENSQEPIQSEKINGMVIENSPQQIQSEKTHVVANENSEIPSIVYDNIEKYSSSQQRLQHHNEEKFIILNTSKEDEAKPKINLHHYKHLSRSEIEDEIGEMVQSILRLNKNESKKLFSIGDSHCYMDVLFEQLNCPNQSIWSYIDHNHRIYDNGINMKYIIQSYFVPRHFNEENWRKRYVKYLDHPVVYGKCGLHPLYSHHYDLHMELNLRRCLSNQKVVAVGEIGLDYRSTSRPSNTIQISTFIQQIRLAKEKNLPVIICSRDSFIPVLQILCNSTSIMRILPESSSPHLMIDKCPNVWCTHPIFASAIYKFIAESFGLSFEQVVEQLVQNM
ncbi:unnamed protein product, partial [Rotaria magnacalcarata]